MKRFLNQLTPFILLGIALVAFAIGIILLSYLFLIGSAVGLVLFTLGWIRGKFSSKQVSLKTKSGRIIDSDDWKKL